MHVVIVVRGDGEIDWSGQDDDGWIRWMEVNLWIVRKIGIEWELLTTNKSTGDDVSSQTANEQKSEEPFRNGLLAGSIMRMTVLTRYRHNVCNLKNAFFGFRVGLLLLK
jgi:hypothetical protein